MNADAMQRHVLACAVSEPGQWTITRIEEDMDVSRSKVKRAAYVLRTAGLLRPIGWYAVNTDEVPAGIGRRASDEIAEAVWEEVVAGAGRDHGSIEHAVAFRAGVNRSAVQHLLAQWRRNGALTMATALFPTPAGVAHLNDALGRAA